MDFIKLVSKKKYRSRTSIELKVSVSKFFERYPALLSSLPPDFDFQMKWNNARDGAADGSYCALLSSVCTLFVCFSCFFVSQTRSALPGMNC